MWSRAVTVRSTVPLSPPLCCCAAPPRTLPFPSRALPGSLRALCRSGCCRVLEEARHAAAAGVEELEETYGLA